MEAAAVSEEPTTNALDVLAKRFDLADDLFEVEEGKRTPDDLLNMLVERATTRHQQHVGKIHGSWARLIGLSSRRASRRVRYAPTDRLLKTLVVCCVDVRMTDGSITSCVRSTRSRLTSTFLDCLISSLTRNRRSEFWCSL